MTAVGWLTVRRLRTRAVALVALALLVALGVGGTLVALDATLRTRGAYDDYLRRSAAGDLVINPGLSTDEIDLAIRHLPGVERVTRDGVFFAGLGDGSPRPLAELDSTSGAIVRGSSDGRHLTMDRPAVLHGRLLRGPGEALVTREAAVAEHLSVGDAISVEFWSSRDDLQVEDPAGPRSPDEIAHPVAVEHLTIVGVVTLADEVLPDRVFPRGQVIVGPDVTARYDCQAPAPSPTATYAEAVERLVPRACSLSYPYYSVTVRGGTAGVHRALDAFAQVASDQSARLPSTLQERGITYAPITTTTAAERHRIERSIGPTTTALGVLAAGAAAVALVVLGLSMARELRRGEAEQLQWWRLGLGSRARTFAAAVPLVLAVIVGLGLAVAAAWLLSPLAPAGTVRAVDPHPAHQLVGWVLLAAAGFAVLGILGVGALGLRSARRAARAHLGDDPGARRPLPARSSPVVAEGLRAAFGTAGSRLVVTSAALAIGALLAALVFGSSLSSVVSRPAAYGWPWDVGVLQNYGYGGQDLDAMRTDLAQRHDVISWTTFGLSTTLNVDGRSVVSIVGLGSAGHPQLTMASGRVPTRRGEVALGSRTARDLGASIGDQVRLGGDPTLRVRRATVTGIAVLPALGSYQSERAAPGEGVVLAPASFEPGVAEGNLSFVGIDLSRGTSVRSAAPALGRAAARWADASLPFVYSAPIRPAEIDNASSMRSVPMTVAGLLTAAAAAGLAVALAASVRARRRHLATLRALGFTRAQVRRSVLVQALATLVTAVVVAVPLGVAAGRLSWRAFASRLGVVPQPSVPVLGVLGVVLGAVVIGVAVSLVPARAAARSPVGQVLRSD
jgi:hypothetical protein